MSKYKLNNKYDPRAINEARRLSGLKEICAKKRICLRCEREFHSEGIHNRLCDACRRGNA